ncbi:hypothetical protein GCM10009127_24460 [Alteraurantiacibacter aestuarii]
MEKQGTALRLLGIGRSDRTQPKGGTKYARNGLNRAFLARKREFGLIPKGNWWDVSVSDWAASDRTQNGRMIAHPAILL